MGHSAATLNPQQFVRHSHLELIAEREPLFSCKDEGDDEMLVRENLFYEFGFCNSVSHLLCCCLIF